MNYRLQFAEHPRSASFTSIVKILIMLIIAFTIYCAPAISKDGTWPKVLRTPQGNLTLYQPQPESFDSKKGTIEARAALSFTGTDSSAPTFGAILFTAQYDVNREARTARLKNITIKDWKFPNATDEQAKQLQDYLNNIIAEKAVDTSLDELIHSLKGINNTFTNETDLNNNPPKIIYRERPAALVVIDGDPIQRKIDNTTFERVINTPYMLLYDTQTARYYLNGNNLWFNSARLDGNWTQAQVIPDGLEEAAKSQGLEDIAPESVETNVIPEIIISNKPTELISVDGTPKYSQIDGAGLLYINNTSSVLILDISEQEYYTLISGRWYTSNSLDDDAEWSYVVDNKVPEEFYSIPENEQTDTILAAIPNTPQANEAVLDASIPQTAEVDLDSPSPEVSYDGEPEFDKTGSDDTEYAVNTSASVIKSGRTYYLCDDAVWYQSTSPNGPWRVCREVPSTIYNIPPSCPVYNTTYVRIYGYTPRVAYYGYTPGYLGSYICNGVVVYGTGYWYRPWYRRYFFPRPYTWGFGVRYNPWTGRWGFGIGYRRWRGGGFFFGIGFGGGWYGPRWRGGWWGRGGYHDRNLVINNNININKINTHDRVRDNIYKNRDNIQTLQERRDSLKPEQLDKRKDALKDRANKITPETREAIRDKTKDLRDKVTPETREAIRDKTKDLRDNVTPETREAIRDKTKDLRDNVTPETREAIRDKTQNLRDNITPETREAVRDKAQNLRDNVTPQTRENLSNKAATLKENTTRLNTSNQPSTRISNNWQESSRQNNVYSDRSGNVFRSNPSTNNWQKLNNNGTWRNTQPTRQLNQTRSNRISGATRSRQQISRPRPQPARRPTPAARPQPARRPQPAARPQPARRR